VPSAQRGQRETRTLCDVNIFGQAGHDIRLEWSGEGIGALGGECAVLVVVDVLSFSTTTDLVLERGGRVLPLLWQDAEAERAARKAGAVLAGERGWSLRPASVLDVPPGTLLALPSPNGASLCAAAATTGAHVLTACLRNARAVARHARYLAEGRPVGVIPAGERWAVGSYTPKAGHAGTLRPSVEDLLGAGAVVDALIAEGLQWPSAEASMASRAFRAAGPDVGAVVRSSSSAKELIEAGHGRDVDLAAEVDVSDVTPYLVDGVLHDAAPYRRRQRYGKERLWS
jgi:2-phosphosulfolactate phosphatase